MAPQYGVRPAGSQAGLRSPRPKSWTGCRLLFARPQADELISNPRDEPSRYPCLSGIDQSHRPRKEALHSRTLEIPTRAGEEHIEKAGFGYAVDEHQHFSSGSRASNRQGEFRRTRA
jgi:hypothetical protein